MPIRPTPRSLRREPPRVEELEPRVLFSADLAALVDTSSAGLLADSATATASAQYVQSAVVAAQAGSATTDAAAQQRVELVFVDSGVTDASHLVADLQAQRGDGRTLLVFTLDAAQDGLKQISDVLARYQATQGQGGVDAVHLITHGDAQGLQIGSTWLNADNLMQHAAQIAGWGASLNTHADLLLYGCDLAASATGRLLADDLGLLTGADVAASTNVTGAAAQGGDWTLEYAHGAINAQVAANAATQADWQGTLLLTASGSETRVNTTTSGTQTTATNRQVAIDGSGNSVAVWQTGTTIYGQRFDSTGAKVGSEFKMSTSGGLFNSVNNPQVAMNASGAYAVTWYEYNPGLFGILLPSWTVYLQRFNAAGVSQGVTKVFDNLAFLTFSGDPQMYSAVSMDASGNIAVVSREDSEVDIEWYNSSGTKTGAARVDDSSNSNTKTEVSVSTTTAGTVVTWTESGTEIVGQLYNASHVAVGGNFRVNTTTSGSQTQSSVGMDGTGAFVVSWTSTQGGTSDIYAQRFSNAGAKVGSEFLVNNTTAYDQTASSVAVDGGGAFVIAWQSNLQDGSGTGIYMRQYQSDGFAGLYDQRVNTTTTNAQSTPSVAVNGTRAVVLWNGNGTGDSSGVFAQRFTVGTNQAPTATLGASNLNYTENAGALALDSAATLTDADNSTLQGATVQITGNYVSSEDVLAFTNALGITGSWNASTGTLTLSGVALVSSYQTALRSITYTNTSDNPSAAVRTVSVSVTDGQLGSGVATKTITVLPVNDAPTISAPSVWIVPVGIGANITGITITDLDAGTGLVTLTLTAAGGVFNATSAGGVTVGGDGTAALTLQGQVSDINAFIAASSLGVSSIQYTGATSVSLQLAVDDGGNTGSGGAQTVSWNAAISTVAFTPPSLVAPATLTALEDTPTQLTGWTVSAPHAGSNSIQLTLTAGAGTLSATSGGGVTVSNPVAGTLVLVGSVDNLNTFIANGLVGYQGATDANGNVNLTLLLDDLAQNPAGVNLYANASLTIAITPVNDAPQGSSGTVTMFEDHARTFTAADFGFTDPQDSPADALLGVYIDSLPGAGTLALNGVAVQAGDFVAATSLGSLAFTPAASANGAGYASFTFRVRDSGGTANGGADTDLTSRTLAIDVAAINSAPQGTDAIATMLEDASYTFSAADFGFTDPQDPTPNALLGVVISSLPAAGTLTVSGVAVQDGDLIAVANLGNLVYTPEANGFGAAHASFTFQVRDDGGTANGGADTDLTPRTMTLSVTAVNDAPQAADGTVLTMQKTAYTFQVADFGFTDVTDAPSANALQAIRVVTLPNAGVLTLQGAAVTAGQVVLASEIAAGHLQFAPTGDDHGTPYAHFTFQVQDNGGTANGGVDWDATVHTLTINVVTPDSAVPALTLPPLADTHIEAGAAAVKVVATVAAAPAQPANDAGIGGGRFGEFAVRALNVDVVQAAYAIDANTGLAETGRGYAADWLAEAGKPAPIQWLLDQIQNQRQTASDGVASTAARQQLVQWTDGSEAQSLQGVAASVKSGGVAVSVGMVWWATRLSGLVTGLMASTPAWRSLDPLPILGGTADESDDDDQGFGPTESGEDSDFEHEAAKGRRARPKAGDLFAHGAPSAGQLGNGGAGR